MNGRSEGEGDGGNIISSGYHAVLLARLSCCWTAVFLLFSSLLSLLFPLPEKHSASFLSLYYPPTVSLPDSFTIFSSPHFVHSAPFSSSCFVYFGHCHSSCPPFPSFLAAWSEIKSKRFRTNSIYYFEIKKHVLYLILNEFMAYGFGC